MKSAWVRSEEVTSEGRRGEEVTSEGRRVRK